jgi:hypothetical protein
MVMLAVLPARAQPQDHAPTAQVIQRGGLARQYARIADGERRDERAEVDAPCVRGEPRQRDDHLQRVEVWFVRVGEVIGAEQPRETQFLHRGDQRDY